MANFKVETTKKNGEIKTKPIGDLKGTHTINYKGRKIGFIGLCDESWLNLFKSWEDGEDSEVGVYLPATEEAIKLSKELRNDGCDYIIALTHMEN